MGNMRGLFLLFFLVSAASAVKSPCKSKRAKWEIEPARCVAMQRCIDREVPIAYKKYLNFLLNYDHPHEPTRVACEEGDRACEQRDAYYMKRYQELRDAVWDDEPSVEMMCEGDRRLYRLVRWNWAFEKHFEQMSDRMEWADEEMEDCMTEKGKARGREFGWTDGRHYCQMWRIFPPGQSSFLGSPSWDKPNVYLEEAMEACSRDHTRIFRNSTAPAVNKDEHGEQKAELRAQISVSHPVFSDLFACQNSRIREYLPTQTGRESDEESECVVNGRSEAPVSEQTINDYEVLLGVELEQRVLNDFLNTSLPLRALERQKDLAAELN